MQLLQGGGYNRSKEEGATDSKRVMEEIMRAVGWSYKSEAIWQYESAQGHSEGPKEIGT